MVSLMHAADALRLLEIRLLQQMEGGGADFDGTMTALLRALEYDARRLLTVEEYRNRTELLVEQWWVPLCETLQCVRMSVEQKISTLVL